MSDESTPAPAPVTLVEVLHGAKFSKKAEDKPTLSEDGTTLKLVFRKGRELHNVRIHSETGFKVSRQVAKKKVKVSYDYDQAPIATA